ncbi:EamA family transporter [Oxalobacteraceae sp. CFBP 13708]|nr:EamA family transporter [Oxalobacteraceae sp. CFBP 8761]MBD8725139.1 EamA family transporter [Oxalobacteraceae sp. CFBP 13708]
MAFSTFILIFSSVLISALAQIALKQGMSSSTVSAALGQGTASTITAIATNPYVIGGLSLYALGAVLWLFVLSRVDVSVAYPFVAFGFIVTMGLAIVLLGEPLQPLRVAGTLLVVAGAVLITR